MSVHNFTGSLVSGCRDVCNVVYGIFVGHNVTTKMIQGMKNFKYPERLRQLELPTLAYRRNRGDMIVTRTLLYQPARFYLLLTEASLGQDFQPDLLLNYISCHG